MTYHYVCYNDYSVLDMVAASRMHGMFGPRQHAMDRNVLDMRRCEMSCSANSQSSQPWAPTKGALELAGMALSLDMVDNDIKMDASEGLRTDPRYVDVTLYTPHMSYAYMVTRRNAVSQGARHLDGLVRFVGRRVDQLRRRGHVVKLGWAERVTRPQMMKARELACESGGARHPWPDGLVELLEAANRIVHEAPEDDAELMRDLF